MDTLIQQKGKSSALSSEMGENIPIQNDKTQQNDMPRQLDLRGHVFATNDDDGTNLTYVDEDEQVKEPRSNHDLARDVMKSSQSHNKGIYGNEMGAWKFLRDGKKTAMSANLRPRKEHQTKDQREESDLVQEMWPLRSVYQSPKEWKSKSVDLMADVTEYDPQENRKLERVINNNSIKVFPWRIITGLKDKEMVKITPNVMAKDKTFPIISLSPDISHLAERTRNTTEHKLKENRTLQSVNIKGSHRKFIHHTNFIHGDSRLDIVNVLPEKSTSSVREKSTKTKPRFIHSKAQAIEEIVKALGNNNKIVKDANGLYLITGKHVKIIHRTPGRQLSKKQRETLNTMSELTSKTSPRLVFHNVSQSLAPVLTIRTRKPSETLRDFSKSLYHDLRKKVGLPLASYNLKDLEKKLRSKFSGLYMSKIKDQNKDSTNFEILDKRKTPINKPSGQENVVDDITMFEKMGHLGRKVLVNVEQRIVGQNGGHGSNMVNGQRGDHGAIKESGGNETSDEKFNKNSGPRDGLNVSEKNPKNAAETKSEIRNVYHVDHQTRSFLAPNSNNSKNFHSTFQETEPPVQDLALMSENYVQALPQNSPLGNEKHNSNVSATNDSFVTAPRNRSRDRSRDVPKEPSRRRNEKLNDVHVEIVEEEKPQDHMNDSSTLANVEQKDEDVEIIDEDSEPKTQPEGTTLQGMANAPYVPRDTGSQGTNESPGTIGSSVIAGSPGPDKSPGRTGSLGTTESPKIAPSQGTIDSPGATESPRLTKSTETRESSNVVELPIEISATLQTLGRNDSVGTNQSTTADIPQDITESSGENDFTEPTKLQESLSQDSSQNMGPLLAEDIQNNLHLSEEPEQVIHLQTLDQGSKDTPGKLSDDQEDREPMVPKRIVDALLASIIKDYEERSIHRFKANSISNGEILRTQTIGKYVPDSFPSKLSPGENHEDKQRLEEEIKNQGLTEEVEEKVKHRNEFQKNPEKASDNSMLDALLERFVNLLHRRLKKLDRARKLKSRRAHREFPATKTPTGKAIALLKYQEELLQGQQRRLEHQLAVEEKMLAKNRFSVLMNEKQNEDTGPVSQRAQGDQRFGKKNEQLLRNLKAKIHRLNEEKHLLLDKLTSLKLRTNMEPYEGLTVGDEDVAKMTKKGRGSSVTEFYDHLSQGTDTAPYMNSRITYSEIKGERPYNEGTVEHSYESLRHRETEQPLTDYEETTTEPEEHQPGVDLETEVHSHQEPEKKLANNHHFMDPGDLKDLDKSQDFLPYNTHDKLHYVQFPPTSAAGKETSQEIPTSGRRPEETAGQTSQSKFITNASPNIPGSPTPSFINKEANYASDTADMFTNQILDQDTPHDTNYQGTVNERSKTLSLPKSLYVQQPEAGSMAKDTSSRTQNIFPGIYSYGEDPTGHQGIPRASQWQREDPLLMKEMPEYFPQDNTIESKSLPGRYAIFSSQKLSSVRLKSPFTTTAGPEDEEEEEKDSGREEHEDVSEEFQKTTEGKPDSAFEVVDEEDVPTMRRKTDNPEDGVEDKTFINGDEYHLQKKQAIEKKDKKDKKKGASKKVKM